VNVAAKDENSAACKRLLVLVPCPRSSVLPVPVSLFRQCFDAVGRVIRTASGQDVF